MKLAIVCGEFHKELAIVMVASAMKTIINAGHTAEIFWVPGSYEAPIAMQKMLELTEIDAGVFLGYIERGETLHGEVMGHITHQAMTEMSLRLKKPIGVGVIGPGATLEQAQKRKVDYAAAAAQAAMIMVERLSGRN